MVVKRQYIGRGQYIDCTYFDAVSNPSNKDTDGDGILDHEDTAPRQKGMAGGIVGELILVSAPGGIGSSGSGLDFGHAFLGYKSYINDVIDLTGFHKGYVYDKSVDYYIPLKSLDSYKIKSNEFLSIGNWGDNSNSYQQFYYRLC